jgi:hypothetical protein
MQRQRQGSEDTAGWSPEWALGTSGGLPHKVEGWAQGASTSW